MGLLKIYLHWQLGIWSIRCDSYQYYLQQGSSKWLLDPLTAVFVGRHKIGIVQNLPYPVKVRVRHGHLHPLTLEMVHTSQGRVEVLTARAISLRTDTGRVETFPLFDQTCFLNLRHPIVGQHVKLYASQFPEQYVLGIRRWPSGSRRISFNRYSFRAFSAVRKIVV